MALVDGNSVIELRNVGLKFESDWVLRDVNLNVQKSDRCVIIGPSGEGKTSLLKLMAGLLMPSTGEISRSILDWKKCGMLFQKNALFDSLSVGENVAFPLREVTGLSEQEIDVIVDKFLDSVGILQSKPLFPDEISGGMQKRLGIARALALKPELIFYDDPTAGLDPITSRKIIDLILHLQNESQATVVAVTNDMNRAYQLATKIIFVAGCEVIETGSPEETRAHPDPRVQQFIHGKTSGPLTAAP